MVYPLKMGGSFHTLYTPSTTRWSSTHLRTALSGHKSAEVLCFAVHLHLRVERLSAARAAFVFAFPNSAEKIPQQLSLKWIQMVDSPVFFTHFLHIIRKSIGLLNPVESWQEARGCHGALQSSSDLIFFRKEGRLPVDWAAEKNYFLRVIPTMTFWLVVDLPLWKKYFTSSDPHHDILTF